MQSGSGVGNVQHSISSRGLELTVGRYLKRMVQIGSDLCWAFWVGLSISSSLCSAINCVWWLRTFILDLSLMVASDIVVILGHHAMTMICLCLL